MKVSLWNQHVVSVHVLVPIFSTSKLTDFSRNTIIIIIIIITAKTKNKPQINKPSGRNKWSN